MKSSVRKILTLIVLLSAGIAIAFWKPWQSDEASSYQLYGNVDVRAVQLAFRSAGRLLSMNVDEGDRVQPGELLASLDPEVAEEALAVAVANEQQAQAQLAGLRAGARPQEIAQAQAQVRVARVAFENASSDAERQESLIKTQSTSRTALDAARAARDRAAAQLASAEEALELAEAGAREEDIHAAEAALSAAKARLEQARTAVADTQLRAPSPGIILTRAREPGSMVQSGQTVYALALTDRVYVRAYVDEPRLGLVAPGTRVRIRTDSTEHSYTGQVGFVSPQAEFTPKTVQTPELRTDLVYRLRIIVEDADSSLLQGMPVTIELPSPARNPDVNDKTTPAAGYDSRHTG